MAVRVPFKSRYYLVCRNIDSQAVVEVNIIENLLQFFDRHIKMDGDRPMENRFPSLFPA